MRPPSASVVPAPNLTQTYTDWKHALRDEVCLAYCVRVIDADTAVFNVRTKLGVFEFHVRLAHLDSPELKSPEPEHRRHARACKALVEHLIVGKYCVLRAGSLDKYGRLLGELYLPGRVDSRVMALHSATDLHVSSAAVRHDDPTLVSLNALLLAQTPCVPYEGKAKQPFVFDLSRYHREYLRCWQQEASQ